MKYASVHKAREKGRVVKVGFGVIFDTLASVMAALAKSQVSKRGGNYKHQ